MPTKNPSVRWTIAASVAVAGVAPLFVVWAAIGVVERCPAIPAKDAPFGCVEFLLDRYQALIAAVIAAFIAYRAIGPVLGQLREMRRQSAAASVALIEAAGQSIYVEYLACRKLYTALMIYADEMEDGEFQPSSGTKLIKSCNEFLDALNQRFLNFFDREETTPIEKQFIAARIRAGRSVAMLIGRANLDVAVSGVSWNPRNLAEPTSGVLEALDALSEAATERMRPLARVLRRNYESVASLERD